MQTRELIALGIAIASHCEGCIAYHVHDALRSGATSEEALDAIGVAVMMGGGPGSVFGAEAVAALEQFEAERGRGVAVATATSATSGPSTAAYGEDARALLDGLPHGAGLNIAHEAVDRHVLAGHGDRVAARSRGDRRRSTST